MLHNIALRQKIITMTAVMSGLFLVALDQTIISAALARIVEEFNSFSSLGWVVTSYLLASTVTVPLAGKFSDIFGRRLMLLIGVSVFTLSSLLAGGSANVEQLIAFRTIQGIGGGIIMANAFTIVGDLFSPRERGKWQGFISAVFAVSSIVGPLLGGYLTDPHAVLGMMTSWRWTFWINVPIGLVSFLLIARYCPPIRHDHRPRIDYLGAALLTLSLSSVILAVDNTEHIFAGLIAAGWSLGLLQGLLYGLALLSAAGFVWAEHRAEEPIIPLSFFVNRTFSAVMVAALLFGAAFLGAILYLTQFNIQVFGASATSAGLMLLPMIAGMMASSLITGHLVSRSGRYKLPIMLGFALATSGVFALSSLTPESPYLQEAIIMTVIGIGMGTGMPIMNLAVQNEFKQRDLGAATASSQLFRGLGSTIGTAVLGTMMTVGVTANLGDINDQAYVQSLRQFGAVEQLGVGGPADVALNLNTEEAKQELRSRLASADIDPATRQEIEAQQAGFSSVVEHAFSDSLRYVFLTSSALMVLAIGAASFIRERPLRGGEDETPGVA